MNNQLACKRSLLSNLPRVKKGYITLSRVRACARTLHFCTFCFHNLHRFLHKQLSINLLPRVFKHIFRESVLSDWKEAENREKGRMSKRRFHQEIGEEKTEMSELLKKTSEFFGKTWENIWKKSNVLGRISMISRAEQVIKLELVWRLWKQKVQNPCGAGAYAGTYARARPHFFCITEARKEFRKEQTRNNQQSASRAKRKEKLT